ncbi:MAG: Ppx/GppA family phosphatase [Hyphomicrobium sp.]
MLIKCTTSVIQETPDDGWLNGHVTGSREARRWGRALKGFREDSASDAPNTKPGAREAPIGKPGADPDLPPESQPNTTIDGQPQQSAAQPSDVIAVPPLQDSRDHIYGALDLGTNNCRLLLARPSRRGFRVVDAFSRIIRLGEGVIQTGRLSDDAMQRTLDALKVCAAKLERARVRRARFVATEACRVAANGSEFIADVHDKTGIDFEVLTPESEARLAVSGSAALIDATCDYVLVFDIGGGSSELILLDLTRWRRRGRRFIDRLDAQNCMAAWTSLPLGVVTLAERFGGRHVTPDDFEAMVQHTMDMLHPFEAEHTIAQKLDGRRVHMLGTSGTVTTVAGVQLKLPRYDRNRVDGCWLSSEEVRTVSYDLLGRTYEQRVAEPSIGRDRADLVLAGCAILEAVLRIWPCQRLRVADRGLREGILTTLMSEDGVYRQGRRRRPRRRR